MAGNQENILVDFDYNNIIIVDPNKVIDENGRAKERLVRHEELVMYANLECKVLPRTKLAIGVDNNDAIQTVSIASINFLKPGGRTTLDTKWTDEITGKDSLKGEGVNQPKSKKISNPKKDDDFFIRQTITSGGKPGAVDNGLLGITNITVKVNTAFNPQISIRLVDVKGRALFEGADNSPYAAFFNLPYPTFYLTLKGYYGKAIRLSLMLQSFSANFNSYTSDFDVNLQFLTYKYTVLQEVNMGSVLAVPHMYKSRVKIQTLQGTPSQFTPVDDAIVERGYQKVKEVYSEYKSKGLIPSDFPEITVIQMKDRIENFIKNVLDTFTKVNLDPITYCDQYGNYLQEFGKDVYYTPRESWFDKYMDKTNPLILSNGKIKVYTFKKEFIAPQSRKNAEGELDGIIKKYEKLLLDNPVVGANGKYKINDKEKRAKIDFNVTMKIFKKEVASVNDIDIKETYRQVKGIKEPNQNQLEAFKVDLLKNNTLEKVKKISEEGEPKDKKKDDIVTYYAFEGPGNFVDLVDNMNKSLKGYREDIEAELTEALSKLLQDKKSGIGFIPNIRNVLAVIFASGEAFLRLLDDVHRQAWEKRDSPIRKSVIFDKQIAGASQDNISSGADETIPVYPWPQVLVETAGERGQEKYEIKYPADKSIVNRTKAYLYDEWPEVEFVEEFIKAFTERTLPPADLTANFNEQNQVFRVTVDAIEYPIGNNVYSNKEEVKFFFEIYERLILVSYFSRLSRSNGTITDSDLITNFIAQCENYNLLKSLSNDNPFIIQKLKQYGINSSNFLLVLRQFSNQGLGESWQNYIRGIFNTSYIKNTITNSSSELFFSPNDSLLLNKDRDQPLTSLPSTPEFVKYIDDSTTSNKFDMLDIYPFTNIGWVKTYLANGERNSKAEDSFTTTKTLTYNTNNKVICSYPEDLSTDKIRPISNFIFETLTNPSVDSYTNLKNFYLSRFANTQLPTEGDVKYYDYSGLVTNYQTTSIFNTPYFINSIQKGVQNFRNNDPYPFVEAAYLFINSLPLSTLREKFREKTGGEIPASINLDYIYAGLKKFGAIHKVPYAWILKLGSIWYRYKKYVNEDIDIMTDVWSGFSYTSNYDPVTNSNTKNYSLTINNVPIDIVLQKDTIIGSETSSLINTGFYPKLINDFNVFYQGYNVINPYLTITGTCSISNTTLTVTSISSDNLQVGNIIAGNGITVGTTIVAQTSGILGSTGTYIVDISQNTGTINFTVTNSTIQGYSDLDIQNSINNSGLTLNYSQSAIISFAEGFDPNNLDRDLRIIPWSVTVDTPDRNFMFAIPSNGSLVNQTLEECFSENQTQLKFEVNNNQAVYDGSVRLFWCAPNYGYFDNSKLVKPQPDQYLKEIFSAATSSQENFSINGQSSAYSKMSEMLSVFDKQTLDKFEQEFLLFSKSIYDYEPNDNDLETTKSFKNFQMLMTTFMKLPKITGNTGDEVIQLTQAKQLEIIEPKIRDFMKYDVLFKFGNPGNFDRRLFYTFSNSPITDGYTWGSYKSTTPNALPINGGTITLADSILQYPEEWAALRTYVGFSEISQLEYKDSGSYITDFFIDLDVAFTVDNIQNFATIIKIYATQKLNQFQPEPIPPTEPPITNPPGLEATAKLKDGSTIDVIKTGPFKQAVFKNSSGTIIFTTNRSVQPDNQIIIDTAIIAVYTTTSTDPEAPQYIVQLTNPPPPSYPQVPNPQSKQGLTNFYETMTNYLSGVDDFINKIIDNLMPKLQSSLPNVNNVEEAKVDSNLEGNQTKVDLYESFKSLNDKWISGNDFKTKTLFEDVLLMDRANRNIGDKILVDVYKLKDILTNINPKSGMLSYVQSILVDNHFVVMNIPAYVNFYNVQDAVKNPKPKTEGSLEFANTLFGTHMSVDYRESSTKLVCFYAGKPSEILDIKKNVDFRYRNDAFDLRRASENPLVENQVGKNDWDKSNRVVGFNVDIGPQNQGVFKSFSVGQGAGLATAESLAVLNQMANQAGNRGGTTQSVSLYNVYKNRSYNCTVQMMGNALIQPTMYFNLRYVPMFSGPYMILDVTHTISPGVFETTFTGIRQPIAGLPQIDNYLQVLKTNLLKSIVNKNKEKQKKETKDAKGNVISQSNKATAASSSKKDFSETNTCEPMKKYSDFTSITPSVTKTNLYSVREAIMNQISASNIPDDGKLKFAVFVALYLNSGNSTGFDFFENNYAGVDLNQYWGDNPYISQNKQYFCADSSFGTLPYAVFDNLESSVKFLIERWYKRTAQISSVDGKNLYKFWVINFRADTKNGESVYKQQETQTATLSQGEAKAQAAIDAWKGMDTQQ